VSGFKKAPGKIDLLGFLKNPLFYFVLCSFFLFGALYASCSSLDSINGQNSSHFAFFNSFFNKKISINTDNLFSSRTDAIPLETPDMEIIQDNTVHGVSAPQVVSGKVLGDAFGGNSQNQKDIIDYTVQPGDSIQSIANTYNISVNTLLWANDITSSSTIKVGQDLTILPVDGVLHVVKSGDTISAIASKYKANPDIIISYNDLANQDDIYIGDILTIPGGVMPKAANPAASPVKNQILLPNNFFIFPTQGILTQGLHFYNAVDIANNCGTPIYAPAAGVVQRVVLSGWNEGMGNYMTILHSHGVVTYYAHLQSAMVRPGDTVSIGQNIGFMGGKPGTQGAGNATGCHLHWSVVGTVNPLGGYPVGSRTSYK